MKAAHSHYLLSLTLWTPRRGTTLGCRSFRMIPISFSADCRHRNPSQTQTQIRASARAYIHKHETRDKTQVSVEARECRELCSSNGTTDYILAPLGTFSNSNLFVLCACVVGYSKLLYG